MAVELAAGRGLLLELLGEAWPRRVPAEEGALARSLLPDRAVIVATRLQAILAVEGGRSVNEAASSIPMDRIAFFRLRRRWDEQRSLRSLTPFAGRAVRRVGAGRDAEAKALDDLVANAGRVVDTAWMVDTLLAQGWSMSRQTAARLVRDAVDRASMAAGEIARELGELVLVDFAGTAMSVGGEVVAVCLVVETSTRFILGAASGLASRKSEMMELAMRQASSTSFRNEWLAEGGGLPPGRLRIVVPDASVVSVPRMEDVASGRHVQFLESGERRFGRDMARLLGHRIGRLSLHPRALGSGVAPRHGMAASRELDEFDAAAFVLEAVRDHNAARFGLLMGSIETADAAMATRLRAAVVGSTFVESFAAMAEGFEPWRAGAARVGSSLELLDQIRRLMF